MRLNKTEILGAWIIELAPVHDPRGYFVRSWSMEKYAEYGLNPHIEYMASTYNALKGTLRGMHYQAFPYEEVKTIWCVHVAIYDVILDLRSDSPTYGKWCSIKLVAGDQRLLYVPEGVAHGYQTLEDHTEVTYAMSQRYEPESARGVRWNDPAFGIRWPQAVPTVISARDEEFVLWGEERTGEC